MADNSVFITGIADGVMQQAMDELPPWATQKTAQDIEKVLRDTLKMQTKAFSNLAKALTSKPGSGGPGAVDDEFKKLADELKKEGAKRRKRAKDDEDEHNKEKKRWKDYDSRHPRLMAMWSALIWAGDKVKDTFIQNVKAYDELTKAGINVVAGFDSASSGFRSLSDLVAITGVRYTELTAALTKYNTAINAIGLNKFAKAVAASTRDMQALGFTAKESGELLGSYLESQRGYTDAQNRTYQELSEDLKKYGERITKLSMITGQSRMVIMANIEAISKSNEASILAANLGHDAADATIAFIGSIKNQNLGKAILKMMTDQIKPLNETFMSFQKIGLGGFGQKLMAFTQSLKGLDPAEAAQRIKQFEAQNRAEIEYGKQQANLYSQVPELAGEANKALTTFNELQQTARSTVELSEADLEKLKKTNAARTRLSNEWEKLQSIFQRTFSMTLPLMEFMADVLTVVNKGLETVSDFLKNNTLKDLWTRLFSITKEQFVNGAKSMWESIKSFFTIENFKVIIKSVGESIKEGISNVLNAPLSDLVGTILLAVSAFAALKAAISVKDSFFDRITRSKEDTGGIGGGRDRRDNRRTGNARGGNARSGGRGITGAIGDGLGNLGKGIGDFIGGVGSGVGKLLEGVLTGLAKGLTAMGNPKVLLGATGLLVVSGALWVASEALENFMKIDWTAMGKAGVALVGLGLAGAAAGAAAPLILAGAVAFGAMGAALWVIGQAMQAVGPGLESVAKGIGAFGAIDGGNLIKVAGGITALGAALVAFSALTAVAGVGGIISSITNGLAKLGGGDVMTQLKNFAAMGESLQKAATAITSISTSFMSLSTILGSFTGLDTMKSIVSTINNLDMVKALAFAAISKLGGNVSLPPLSAPTSTGVSKTPVASTLDSPSKSKAKEGEKTVEPQKASEPIRQAGPGIEKAKGDGDINSILRYQTSLLEQLVQGNESIVSVNKDILKFTRVRT